MSANSPCLRAHDLIDKLAMSPSTYKRRTAPQKVASSKEKAEPPKKAAMPPARRGEPQQATCEYNAVHGVFLHTVRKTKFHIYLSLNLFSGNFVAVC